MLKTILAWVNVTIDSEIVHYHYELDVKYFTFFFLLREDIYGVWETTRIFLENQICPRSRKVTEIQDKETYKNQHQKGTGALGLTLSRVSLRIPSKDCFSYVLPHCVLPGISGSFPQDSTITRIVTRVCNTYSEALAVSYHFKGYSDQWVSCD